MVCLSIPYHVDESLIVLIFRTLQLILMMKRQAWEVPSPNCISRIGRSIEGIEKTEFLLILAVSKSKGMFTPTWITSPEATANTNIWTLAWHLFIIYLHNILIMENNTYFYTEYTFFWSTVDLVWGWRILPSFSSSLWFLEVIIAFLSRWVSAMAICDDFSFKQVED